MALKNESPDIYAALRIRYCAPEHALFFEVANGTGSNIRRYADAVAMNLFPSRGLTLSGFEVKASRSDWQRELKSPHKAEEGVFKFCDYWWVVAPEKIVDKAELPRTWGLLELLKDGKLRQAVAAPALDPQEMNRNFIAALLRRASEVDTGVINALVRKQVDVRVASIEKDIENAVKRRLREVERKMEIIEGIERQAGISLTDWAAHDGYGRIIKAVEVTGIAKQWSGLRQMAVTLSAMLERINGHLTAFDAIAPNVPKPGSGS